jgi:hypothetical protein
MKARGKKIGVIPKVAGMKPKPVEMKTITAKRMIALRLTENHILKLDSIANKKKATKTKVIGELIDLAYTGLNDPLPKALNKLYSQILKGIDEDKKQKAD